VTDAPETRYTRSADGTNLAYQVSGGGPLDLVFFHGTGIPLDLLSEDTGFIRLRKRLDSFSRTVWLEGRGMGASEGGPPQALPGDNSDADFIAVLDAIGLERPAFVTVGTAASTTIHFSVTHPERVSTLVLANSYVHYVRETDYPWGVPAESLDRLATAVKENWAQVHSSSLLPQAASQTSAFERGTPARSDSGVASIGSPR
jgi:pimeloyl-ACP methyl ester carboxylesterase